MSSSKPKRRRNTDIYSKKKRSQIMSSIQGKGNLLEIAFQELLKDVGLKFRTNVAKLPGKPDIVFKKNELVIFVDGCFWHGCRKHFKIPRSNHFFWKTKIADNIKRDVGINKFYKEMGWTVFRIWEHQIKTNPWRLITKIRNHIFSSTHNNHANQ